jgi:hypothetical protein
MMSGSSMLAQRLFQKDIQFESYVNADVISEKTYSKFVVVS